MFVTCILPCLLIEAAALSPDDWPRDVLIEFIPKVSFGILVAKMFISWFCELPTTSTSETSFGSYTSCTSSAMKVSTPPMIGEENLLIRAFDDPVDETVVCRKCCVYFSMDEKFSLVIS